MSSLLPLKEEYRKWLKTVGFSESSVKSFPNYINELLEYLQQNNTKQANQITAEQIETFFFQWKKRKNKTTGAGLSQSHINTAITAVNNFIKFLKVTGKQRIYIQLEREKIQVKIPQVLTQKEVQALYNATYNNTKRVNTTAYGQRDRAMLAIYYGCGLRSNEGYNLLISDILKDKKMLFVRKGKGNKERFVPITDKGLKDIEEYLNNGRKWFLKKRQKKKQPLTNHFFINVDGDPMKIFTQRIRLLAAEAGIHKRFTLHTFRHSIATHLLQSGMDIEQIKKFLGHATLESTQKYTHIINEYEC